MSTIVKSSNVFKKTEKLSVLLNYASMILRKKHDFMQKPLEIYF